METAGWWRDPAFANNNNNNDHNHNINNRFVKSSIHNEDRLSDKRVCDNELARHNQQLTLLSDVPKATLQTSSVPRRTPRHSQHPQVQRSTSHASSLSVVRGAPSAAAAFFHRAAERLCQSQLVPRPACVSGGFVEAVRRAPAALPAQLLRRLSRRDGSHTGKVKVLLRVRGACAGERSGALRVDARRRQASLSCPQTQGGAGWRPQDLPGLGAPAPRMFAFDGVFTDDNDNGNCNGDPQMDLNTAALCDVIHAVINGYDGCVFCFGHPRLDCGSTVRASVGSALTWLFAAIQEQRRSSGARFSVRVSALSAGRAAVTDLLADHCSDAEQSPGELLGECSGGGRCPSELRASSAEHAARHLDAAADAAAAAPAASSPLRLLLYRLLVYQHRVTESGQVVGGRSRLHLLDLTIGGSQEKDKEMPLSGLGNLLLAIFNGSRNIPYRNLRAAQVVRECLSPVSSHAAMLVHACPCEAHYQDSLTTLQLAARVHRLRHRSAAAKGLYGGYRPPWEPNTAGLRRSSSSEMEPSSSELSADTVIYMGARGLNATVPGRRPAGHIQRRPARPAAAAAASHETWVDGPRAVRPPTASPVRETWVDGPRSEAAMDQQKRLLVSQWLASQVGGRSQAPRPEADGATDRQRDLDTEAATTGRGSTLVPCPAHTPYGFGSPRDGPQAVELTSHSGNETDATDQEADGDADADADDSLTQDTASSRRVEGVEAAMHVWEPPQHHHHQQQPFTVAADDFKLELSFEVELQLAGHRRLSGEGQEQEDAGSDSTRVVLQDACVQVTEEDIAQHMGEVIEDHPLRVLSQENMTVVSTFADSASGSYSLDAAPPFDLRRWDAASPPPPPLCRSHSASAADVCPAARRPETAAARVWGSDVDWDGSLASEPPPATELRLERGVADHTPDLIRGARPAHLSLPPQRRQQPAVDWEPWTLTLPRPGVAEHACPATAGSHSQELLLRPVLVQPHSASIAHVYAEVAGSAVEVVQYSAEDVRRLEPRWDEVLEQRRRTHRLAEELRAANRRLRAAPRATAEPEGLRRELEDPRHPRHVEAQRCQNEQLQRHLERCRARLMMATSFLPGGSDYGWWRAS